MSGFPPPQKREGLKIDHFTWKEPCDFVTHGLSARHSIFVQKPSIGILVSKNILSNISWHSAISNLLAR